MNIFVVKENPGGPGGGFATSPSIQWHERSTNVTDLILDAVRIGLSACSSLRRRPHPDSSRQSKAKQRARNLRAARYAKAHQSTYQPKLPSTYKFATFDFEQYTGRSNNSRHMTIQEQSEHARRWLRVGGFHV